MIKSRENRVPIMMSDAEVQAIDDWRFNNRIGTRSDAVRRLAAIALATEKMVVDAGNYTQTALEAIGKMVDHLAIDLLTKDQRVATLDAYRLLMLAWVEVSQVSRTTLTLTKLDDVSEALTDADRIRLEAMKDKFDLLTEQLQDDAEFKK